jgi:DNA polymerase-3 subunit gamma/tau
VGQDHVVSVLKASIAKNNVSHAYLFFGGRGTGKTSIARIFAKELKIDDQDIIEIDAASNRKIDDVRELRQGVSTMPFSSEYKMYIVDEVHMLTNEAFNALLKTLEEPPKHVIFVLATTEMHKVPDTIISRCQTYTFKLPNESQIQDLLQTVCKKEKIKIDKDASLQIAFSGDRSYRDALGSLEKVMTIATEDNITLTDVETVLGVPSRQKMFDYVNALVDGDKEKAFEISSSLRENGARIDLFVDGLLHILRNMLFVRFAPSKSKEIYADVSEKEQEFYIETLKKDKKVVTSRTLQVFLDLRQNLIFAKMPELLLELATVKILGEE